MIVVSDILAITSVDLDCKTRCFSGLLRLLKQFQARKVPGEIRATIFRRHFFLHLAPALIRSRMNTPQIYFDHEKLVAYQRSIQFVAWANQILENVSSNQEDFSGATGRGAAARPNIRRNLGAGPGARAGAGARALRRALDSRIQRLPSERAEITANDCCI
jgi:hypothetical protein